MTNTDATPTYRRFAFRDRKTGQLQTGDGGAIYNSDSRAISESSLKHCMPNPDLEICVIEIRMVRL